MLTFVISAVTNLPLDLLTIFGILTHMKTFITLIIVALLLALLTIAAFGAEKPLPSEFLKALHQQESSGRLVVPDGGDNGAALGPFQIHRKYWIDSGITGTYEQCRDYTYSKRVVTAYLNRYGQRYIVKKNYEALARIHNGGPSGYHSPNTFGYWQRFKPKLSASRARPARAVKLTSAEFAG